MAHQRTGMDTFTMSMTRQIAVVAVACLVQPIWVE